MNLFKSLCFLCISMGSFVSAANFEDKYLSCTLVQEYNKAISEREASGRKEMNISAIIQEDKAIFHDIRYKFKFSKNDGYDVYDEDTTSVHSGRLLFQSSTNTLMLSFGLIKSDGESKYKCQTREKTLNDTSSELKSKIKSFF